MAKTAQNTVTIKINDKEVQSKPFDFKAYSMINNIHCRGNQGAATLCYDALVYMFRDTAATFEYIETLSIPERAVLCDKVFDLYAENVKEINETLKNEQRQAGIVILNLRIYTKLCMKPKEYCLTNLQDKIRLCCLEY